MERIVVAFAGNPNVGKTALINAISGVKLKVGNWPGVTVEKKEASLVIGDVLLEFVDLPGIYTLSAFSVEERIAQDFLVNHRPHVVVNVVDSTNLERNLFLTTQLLEMEIPMVLALNMWDEFSAKGYRLDIQKLEEALGIPVVPTVAVKGEGKDRLIEKIIEVARSQRIPCHPKYSRVLEEFIEKAEKFIPGDFGYPKRWAAIKILEGDEEIIGKLPNPEKARELVKEFEEFFGDYGDSIISEERYAFISALLKRCLKKPVFRKREFTDLLDSILLNRFLGLPIFIFLMYLVFKLTFDGSAPFIDWTDGFINGFIGKWIGYLLNPLPSWTKSLVVNGIIGGVGLVLTFVPLMLFLYFFLALLEESGYLARAAFVMDKFMHSLGLHGKSFIPMIIGFGCNVPAILATRTLESERDRKLTALLIPFMSCGARLPIYALFTAVFFKRYQAEVVLLMYLTGMIVAAIVGAVLNRTVFKEERSPFIMELPPYRLPTFRMLWMSVKLRTWAFVKKAGTVIVGVMVILWIFMNVPYGVEPENTLLGGVAKIISPVFAPCGFSKWQPVAALVPGTIAKEVVVGALGQIYSVGEEQEEGESFDFWKDVVQQLKGLAYAFKESVVSMFGSIKTGVFEVEDEDTPLRKAIRKDFTPLSAFSYMVFCLLWIPCVVTLGAIYQEFGLKMVWYALILTTFVPYIVALIVYNTGRILGF